MNKLASFLMLLVLATINLSTAHSINYEHFGDLPLKDKAVVFAPGLISMPNRYERVVSVSPDGKELYFSTTEKGWVNQRILVSIYKNEGWQEPIEAIFSKGYSSSEPFISPDGKRLYFVSNRPPGAMWDYDIWYVQKNASSWSAPIRLSSKVNSKSGDWHPAVSKNGNLYFGSLREGGIGKADLYFSKFENNDYLDSENIGSIINTEHNEWDPYIDPNERFMIFKSDRPGGYGEYDMYISFMENGQWTPPKNMGPKINTAIEDDAGDISPDGKYLIFSRKNKWHFMDVYWIEVDAIKDLFESRERIGDKNSPRQVTIEKNK